MDVALIARECVDSRLKGSDPGVIYKLHIEKAFDHVNWDFPTTHSQADGFWSEMIEMDLFLHKTVRFSILLNGEPVNFFLSETGLRQGDPLSTFLALLPEKASTA